MPINLRLKGLISRLAQGFWAQAFARTASLSVVVTEQSPIMYTSSVNRVGGYPGGSTIGGTTRMAASPVSSIGGTVRTVGASQYAQGGTSYARPATTIGGTTRMAGP